MSNPEDFNLHTPHDALVKGALFRKEVMADFLENRLPRNTLAKLDLATLRLEPSSFVSEKLRQTHSDVVYSVEMESRKGYVYVLIEAQSSYDTTMPIRLLGYNYQLLCLHHKQNKGGKLPAILNLVLYSGEGAYPGARTLLEAFEDPKLFLESLGQPFVIDLSSEPEDQLIKDKKAALLEMALKHSHLRDFCKIIEEDKLFTSLLIESDYRVPAIIYMLSLEPHKPKKLLSKIAKLAPEKEKEIMNALEVIRNEGLQLGIVKGRQEVARQMIVEGESLSKVSKYTGLSLDELKGLKKKVLA